MTLLFTVVILCVILVGVAYELAIEYNRVDALVEQGYYYLYCSYVATKDEYHAYYMTSCETLDIDSITQFVKPIVDSGLIESLRNHEQYKLHGEKQIKIYFMMPSEEIPYGWWKDEFNISCNFGTGKLDMHTVLILTVPVASESFEDCELFWRIEYFDKMIKKGVVPESFPWSNRRKLIQLDATSPFYKFVKHIAK